MRHVPAVESEKFVVDVKKMNAQTVNEMGWNVTIRPQGSGSITSSYCMLSIIYHQRMKWAKLNHNRCNDVSQIQNKLSIIEEGMATILSMAKQNQHSNPHSQPSLESEPVRVDSTVIDHEMEDEKAREVEGSNGLTAPNHHYHNDRYYGPGTLLALCHRFKRTLLGSPRDSIDNSTQHGLELHLNLLCSEAGSEESISGARPAQITAMQLPPKQLFMVVQSQFFQHCHYATDIFVPSRFRMKVEQLYERPLMPGDEPWAICLHTLTLLVLGPGAIMMLQQLCTGAPGLLAVHAAVTDPSILVAPQLINVQTLTLLVSNSFSLSID